MNKKTKEYIEELEYKVEALERGRANADMILNSMATNHQMTMNAYTKVIEGYIDMLRFENAELRKKLDQYENKDA